MNTNERSAQQLNVLNNVDLYDKMIDAMYLIAKESPNFESVELVKADSDCLLYHELFIKSKLYNNVDDKHLYDQDEFLVTVDEFDGLILHYIPSGGDTPFKTLKEFIYLTRAYIEGADGNEEFIGVQIPKNVIQCLIGDEYEFRDTTQQLPAHLQGLDENDYGDFTRVELITPPQKSENDQSGFDYRIFKRGEESIYTIYVWNSERAGIIF